MRESADDRDGEVSCGAVVSIKNSYHLFVVSSLLGVF